MWRNGHFGDFETDLDTSSSFDVGDVASIRIRHYNDGLESSVMLSKNQLLSNPGGLIHRRSKVMVGSVFWRR